eukprot:gi/632966606/ref/XP_007899512.1/ PREDICTED: cell wall integrity and stress response component 1-like [Callorhinchus milii]
MPTHTPVTLLCAGPNLGFILLRCFIITSFLSSSKSETLANSTLSTLENSTSLSQSQGGTTDDNNSTSFTSSAPYVSNSSEPTDILNATLVTPTASTEKLLNVSATENIKTTFPTVTTHQSFRSTKVPRTKNKSENWNSGAIVAIIIVPVILVVLIIAGVFTKNINCNSYHPNEAGN